MIEALDAYSVDQSCLAHETAPPIVQDRPPPHFLHRRRKIGADECACVRVRTCRVVHQAPRSLLAGCQDRLIKLKIHPQLNQRVEQAPRMLSKLACAVWPIESLTGSTCGQGLHPRGGKRRGQACCQASQQLNPHRGSVEMTGDFCHCRGMRLASVVALSDLTIRLAIVLVGVFLVMF